MVFNALSAVLMVLIIIAIGYFVAARGWANDSVTSFTSNFIVNITMPCTILVTFLGISDEVLKDSWMYIAAAFIGVIVTFCIGKAVAKAAKVHKTRRGVFTDMFSFSNSIFMGLPVALAIFGEGAVIYAIFYYIGNTVLMNSIGIIELERDSRLINGGKSGSSLKLIASSLLKPPLIAVAIGIVLSLAGVTDAVMPDFITSALRYTGNITSPLALVFVGMVLHRTGLSCIKRMDRELSLSLVGRFVVSPLVMFFVTLAMGLPALPSHIMVVQTGLPVMVSVSIYAENIGADTDFAARGIVVSTLLSFISIPLYIALMGV